MFEKAARLKLRFAYRGACSVEDLWDLPLEALDEIYKSLNAELRSESADSLLDKRSRKVDVLKLKISIVTHVVGVKIDEAAEREAATERRAKRDRVLEILAEKQDEGLRDLSEKKLRKLADELES